MLEKGVLPGVIYRQAIASMWEGLKRSNIELPTLIHQLEITEERSNNCIMMVWACFVATLNGVLRGEV